MPKISQRYQGCHRQSIGHRESSITDAQTTIMPPKE